MAGGGEEFKQRVQTALLALFSTLAAGDDVAPGERLRLEGYMQAGIELGLADYDTMLQLMADCYQQVYGQPMPPPFPPGLRQQNIVPVPALMQRAPVYPGSA